MICPECGQEIPPSELDRPACVECIRAAIKSMNDKIKEAFKEIDDATDE